MLTQDLATNLFTDAHFPIFKNPFFLLQCNSKPDWDPQQVAQIGLVYQWLGSALNPGIFQLWSKDLCQRLQLVICSCLTGHTFMSPQISSVHPLFPVTTAGKCFPSAGTDRTELVRMLQKLLVRNSLHWPYWHSWVQAAKSPCRKFSPPALLSLHSHLFFQEFAEYSLQIAIAPTEAVTDSTSLPDGQNLLCTLW